MLLLRRYEAVSGQAISVDKSIVIVDPSLPQTEGTGSKMRPASPVPVTNMSRNADMFQHIVLWVSDRLLG